MSRFDRGVVQYVQIGRVSAVVYLTCTMRAVHTRLEGTRLLPDPLFQIKHTNGHVEA